MWEQLLRGALKDGLTTNMLLRLRSVQADGCLRHRAWHLYMRLLDVAGGEFWPGLVSPHRNKIRMRLYFHCRRVAWTNFTTGVVEFCFDGLVSQSIEIDSQLSFRCRALYKLSLISLGHR